MEIQDVINLGAENVSYLGIAIAIGIALHKKWIVLGWVYTERVTECVADVKFWKDKATTYEEVNRVSLEAMKLTEAARAKRAEEDRERLWQLAQLPESKTNPGGTAT